jgi:hypothetical protein
VFYFICGCGKQTQALCLLGKNYTIELHPSAHSSSLLKTEIKKVISKLTLKSIAKTILILNG